MNDCLGVDIGGVIIDRVGKQDTSFFKDYYLETPAVEGAFDVLRQLVVQHFGTQVHLISKCGERTQERTIHWLDYYRFHDLTGISKDHVHFCRQRDEKAGICKEIGVTHFIDDRLEVLGYLTSVRHLFLFRADPGEVEMFADTLKRVRCVESWNDVIRFLL